VLMRTESLPGPLVFLGMESTSKIFKVFQFFCLTLIRILIRNLATGVNAPGNSN